MRPRRSIWVQDGRLASVIIGPRWSIWVEDGRLASIVMGPRSPISYYRYGSKMVDMGPRWPIWVQDGRLASIVMGARWPISLYRLRVQDGRYGRLTSINIAKVQGLVFHCCQ